MEHKNFKKAFRSTYQMSSINTTGGSVKIKVKVKFLVEQALKAQRRTKSMAVLFI